ncbi:N-formylglutamate amidohydrolase [Blastopirellula marina]|uniref:N-formylglutamate amidohydrolase n=1 Tax=Blastopirellula marina TaxID=124 RepID=A0A2S8G397_9BACT|nr:MULTISPECIES: N-formylglutamate amidohydrolase [Pirellulaceae]PQO38922.1 N-formylglutamate amidohydrolase [Blastopirellula marina]RCS55230.1 N-formylglutamate amidohydrolase [Bremerella cremea]
MKASSEYSILFTCEHGGNRIPREYAPRFAEYQELLQTHRGWDPGTLLASNYFHQQVPSQLFASETSRLLVDLNRSETNPALFSRLVPPPSQLQREELLETYYRPWRQEVVDWIRSQAKRNLFVRHLSFHSFTPELNGQVRTAEIGLLYDPGRAPERDFCHCWRQAIRETFPEFRVRLNYPYRGISDGHTTALRKQFSAQQYSGIELEVNQQLFQQSARQVRPLIVGLYQSWHQAVRQTTGAA